jgi:hypothetical protein
MAEPAEGRTQGTYQDPEHTRNDEGG